jgi:RNA polymerase sigma factor (sigma-70 family)
MPPPPAEQLASRIFLGPALRAQPDRRLVKLVREGYETAFEEIDRRYRRPLDRFAAAIVGNRSEDVTQDALSKALLALRGSEKEIELRPWLYRIVRNTALNDLRDAPPAAAELGEAVAGGRSAALEAERREEISELMERLRALPEPQRAAIVMRELEGLSHEEIAAALGVSGGAARQAIYRARLALRDGLGLLVPLPLLRLLFDHGAEAAGAGGAAAAAGAVSAVGGGTGATLGGLGSGAALKVGVATAVLAGSVGAGVAVQHERGGGEQVPAAAAQLPGSGDASSSQGSPGGSGEVPSDDGGGNRGPGESGHGGDDTRRGRGGEGSDARGERVDDSSHGGRDSGPDDSSGRGRGGSGDEASGHRGQSRGGSSGPEDAGEDRSGKEASGGGHSGRGGSGGGSGPSRGGDGGSGGGDSESGGSGSGSGAPGGGDGDP